MTRLRWLIVCGLLLPLQGMAQTVVGKYAGEFLALGAGGRSLGMGGAAVAVAGDVTAGYWNPAGLSRIDYPQAILMHEEQFGGLANYDYAAFAIPYGATTSLGLSIIRYGVDDIPDTRAAGLTSSGAVTYDITQFDRTDPDRVTYFNAADWAFLFTYARTSSDDFSYGGNLKLIRCDLGDYNATGIGVDVGFLYRVHPNITLGANLQDITTTMLAWNTGRKELITPTVKLGGACFFDALAGRFTPAFDFDIRFENRQYASMMHVGRMSIDVHSGLEYKFRNIVALRVGYTDTKQPTIGAGIHLPKLNIDYSFAKFDKENELGNTHRISLMFTLESDQFKRSTE